MIYIRSCTIIDCITLVDGDRGLGCITSYWRYTILVPYQWSWYLCHERTRELCTWVTNSIPTLVARTTLREFYRIHTRPKLCEPRSICMSHELYIQVTNCIPSLVARTTLHEYCCARVWSYTQVTDCMSHDLYICVTNSIFEQWTAYQRWWRGRFCASIIFLITHTSHRLCESRPFVTHTSHRLYESRPLYIRRKLCIRVTNCIPTLLARTTLREYCHKHTSPTLRVTNSIYTSRTLYMNNEIYVWVTNFTYASRTLHMSHELSIRVTNFTYESQTLYESRTL